MATYPVWEVGDLVTADGLTAMQPDFTYKSTATSRTNNTMTDDPDLVTPTLAANASYFVEFGIRYASAGLATGFRTAWTMPAGVTTANRDVVGIGSTQTDSDNAGARSGVHAYTSTIITYGTRNNNTLQIKAYETSTVFMGATAGTIALSWAQVTTGATATTVAAGSWVRVTRIG
jgi:hypothetical protein